MAASITPGQWVVVESGGGLLAAGDSLWSGQSPRSNLPVDFRTLLLPALARTLRHRVDPAPAGSVRERAGDGRISLQIKSLAGVDSRVLAVAGTLARHGDRPDPEPRVGVWTCDLRRHQVHIGAGLSAVYGADSPIFKRQSWDLDDWLGMTAGGSYSRLLETFSEAESHPGQLVFHQCRLLASDGTERPIRTAIRNSGDGQVSGIGIVGGDEDSVPARSSTVSAFADALITVNPAPTGVVELDSTRILIRNSQWEHAWRRDRVRSLAALLHPSDLPMVKTALRDAPVAGAATTPATICAAVADHASGGFRPAALRLVRLRSASSTSRAVVSVGEVQAR